MTDQEFIELWKVSTSPRDIAAQLGCSYHTVTTRAYRLRKSGHDVPRMTDKRPKDYFSKIGSIGGRRGHTGGFYANRELARIAGTKGGRISRRGKFND